MDPFFIQLRHTLSVLLNEPSEATSAINDYDDDEDSDVAIGNLQFGSGRELEDAEMSALFGIGGIRMGSED